MDASAFGAAGVTLARNWKALRRVLARARRWSRQHLPRGLRLVVGLLLIIGGLFGFLPVLGFWMIPLGLTIAALDLRPVWQAIRRRFRSSDSPKKP